MWFHLKCYVNPGLALRVGGKVEKKYSNVEKIYKLIMKVIRDLGRLLLQGY